MSRIKLRHEILLHIISKFRLIGWVVHDRLLLKDFEPYGIILTNVCVVITVATVMLGRDFWLNWITFVILSLLI